LVIRTIHHQAATGGTLISKCLAAQPRVCLISEVNPLGGGQIRFAPLNLVSQFVAQYKDLVDADLRADFFKSQVDLLVRTCEGNDRELVLRDHSHPDYMRPRPRHGSTLRNHLKDYEVKSVVTIRDPIDSYLSCIKRSWLDAIDQDFSRYCDRILKFVNDFDDVDVYRYEDFCVDPSATMKAMCSSLDLEYGQEFLQNFSTIKLTGDSGRTSPTISPPVRRELVEGLAEAAQASPNYQIICERFGYTPVAD